MNKNIHIALDLDKTIATYESKWRAKKIGDPIVPMVTNVIKWLNKGYKISIFTARLAKDDLEEVERQKEMILGFLRSSGLPQLPMTCIKHTYFTHFLDDKAFHVVPNTGQIQNCPEELL